MTLATITNYTFTGSTQTVFFNNFNTAMTTGAGFTLLDSFTVATTNLQRVYSFTDNASTFGTAILRVGFSAATTLQLAGFSAWNTATDTGSNSSTNFTKVLSSLSGSYTFRAINHPEIRGVWIVQGTSPRCFIGYLRPLYKPTWWDESLYPYFFIDNTLSGLFGDASEASLNTYLSNISSLKHSGFSNANAVAISKYHLYGININDGGRATATDKPTLYYTGNNIEAGQFSEDLILCGLTNLAISDILQVNPSVEEYYVTELSPLNIQSLAVRFA